MHQWSGAKPNRIIQIFKLRPLVKHNKETIVVILKGSTSSFSFKVSTWTETYISTIFHFSLKTKSHHPPLHVQQALCDLQYFFPRKPARSLHMLPDWFSFSLWASSVMHQRVCTYWWRSFLPGSLISCGSELDPLILKIFAPCYSRIIQSCVSWSNIVVQCHSVCEPTLFPLRMLRFPQAFLSATYVFEYNSREFGPRPKIVDRNTIFAVLKLAKRE